MVYTGSLRNIENVWKAEQKRDAEDKKLEELRKQIHEERERSEFCLLEEQAGLIPAYIPLLKRQSGSSCWAVLIPTAHMMSEIDSGNGGGAARLPGFHVCVGTGGDILLPEWYSATGVLFGVMIFTTVKALVGGTWTNHGPWILSLHHHISCTSSCMQGREAY